MVNDRWPGILLPHDTPICTRVKLLNLIGAAGVQCSGIDRLARQAQSLDLPPEEAALWVVQQLPYKLDPPNEEWYYPVWWTSVHGGDCADLVTTYRALGLRLQAPVTIEAEWVTQPHKARSHVIARVTWPNGQWRRADPSVRGARLGETAYDLALQREDVQ